MLFSRACDVCGFLVLCAIRIVALPILFCFALVAYLAVSAMVALRIDLRPPAEIAATHSDGSAQ